MCGIIGYIGNRGAVDVVIEGLKSLEYRGYDSAGVAYSKGGHIDVKRCEGRIRNLEMVIDKSECDSRVAIGHTRWATHGRPSVNNAHPHRSGSVVMVHNGIIENYTEIRNIFENDGYEFSSDTDTEALCHLIEKSNRDSDIEGAVLNSIKEIKGSYAIAVMSERSPDRIVCVRKDSPLVLGIGDEEYFVASDVPAFLSYCNKVIFLENDEMAVLSSDGVEIRDLHGARIFRNAETINWTPSMAEKGGFRHFMLKEIYEQPRAISDTLRGRYSNESGDVVLHEFGLEESMVRDINKIFIVACGTSWHAALIGKYFIEDLAGVPVEVDIASEFRYRGALVGNRDLFISITQSGETADTLAAQREAKRLGAHTLSICNVVGSSSTREADAVFYTHSGPEIGVASTKAFTTQIVSLYLLAIAFGKLRGKIDDERSRQLLNDLLELPGRIESVFSSEETIKEIAKAFFKADDFLYLARGILYPVALEGALKLKEISYIHAEGYPAGEMKHGPIALVDETLPAIFIISGDVLYDKMVSNINEVKSRGGKTVVISDGCRDDIKKLSDYCLEIPHTNKYLAAVMSTVPLQLLAYHIGVLLGCDVDQPRNLAKSVTVE
ncbi:glutamine--fructose-6-phosphate aminotransferase [isomerizing] [bacterium BMS3Abin07]|nr:glutamine--fructose-6-phosphate aminotransferase [isomerizing] [bacterium BMS3Abin07]GBE33418.1 glutamine--fructose-6-phosphate aminotransferase [isomerizing] [bacterium BMS3Bbin05]HDL21060.1 glutamine--fructose-6-phosphate transaminase (isomerizing) [Nitrospirota bacterium]HDO21244.1 glutamine--fructose-6-phosphate transaminase (isomerizing) [Nitrospirota bacterium]HDZ87543.1 glutamine--fructose-6-phosphate transaminase (isomerizing) [Nitrospirota bacterium]